MPEEVPSDLLLLPDSDMNVGAARDILDNCTPKTKEEERILQIAKGLRHVLHRQFDFTPQGYKKTLGSDDRLRVTYRESESFLRAPRQEFPEEDLTTVEDTQQNTITSDHAQQMRRMLDDIAE